MFFGYGASLEKRRLGAKAIPVCAYVQLDEMYQHDIISHITVTSNDKIKKAWKING